MRNPFVRLATELPPSLAPKCPEPTIVSSQPPEFYPIRPSSYWYSQTEPGSITTVLGTQLLNRSPGIFRNPAVVGGIFSSMPSGFWDRNSVVATGALMGNYNSRVGDASNLPPLAPPTLMTVLPGASVAPIRPDDLLPSEVVIRPARIELSVGHLEIRGSGSPGDLEILLDGQTLQERFGPRFLHQGLVLRLDANSHLPELTLRMINPIPLEGQSSYYASRGPGP